MMNNPPPLTLTLDQRLEHGVATVDDHVRWLEALATFLDDVADDAGIPLAFEVRRHDNG